MALCDALLPEFDHEMANTRKLLERVPEEKLDWQPHEKSYTMRGLVTHLSNLPRWTMVTIEQDSLDMDPEGGGGFHVEPVASVGAALETFDKNVAAARECIAGASDQTLFGEWELLARGESRFKMPRIAVLRGFVMSHMIHHRGQLTVYLRLNDVPLPGIYGPTADEAM